MSNQEKFQRAFEEAKDYWDVYYFDDERNRSAIEPEQYITDRLVQRYPEVQPHIAAWLGEAARSSIIDQYNL